jgi:hypothetical protein
MGVILSTTAVAGYRMASSYWDHQKKMWVCLGMYEIRETLTTKEEANKMCRRMVDEPPPDLN